MMNFGDWLGSGRIDNAWYLFLDKENSEVRTWLKSEVKGRIVELNPLLFRVESTVRRKKIEEEILKRTAADDAVIAVFATYGGPVHKILRPGSYGTAH